MRRTVRHRNSPSFLTPRQREILKHVAIGWSNAEIAGELSVKCNTVKNHLNAVARKVKALDLPALPRRARATHILERDTLGEPCKN